MNREREGEFFNCFLPLYNGDDDEMFFNYMRMSKKSYTELRDLVNQDLKSEGNNFRKPISAEEKLVVTLRYLATGSSFSAMSAPFHMSKQVISNIVPKTCDIIWEKLQKQEMPFPTKQVWTQSAKRFHELWDFPRAVAAIDGKHIRLSNPANSGSQFYNYKSFPSIVLMALSDADSFFIAIDCGEYGRLCDAGVYDKSILSTLLSEGTFNIPTDVIRFPDSDVNIPYVIVGDEAFPLKPYLMKPFSSKQLNDETRIYNYRHSRARRIVECAFGILSAKFAIFQRAIMLSPEKAVSVTKCACVLHNFIRRRDGNLTDRKSNIEYDSKLLLPMNSLRPLEHAGRHRTDAANIRDAFKNLFSTIGSIPWQRQSAHLD